MFYYIELDLDNDIYKVKREGKLTPTISSANYSGLENQLIDLEFGRNYLFVLNIANDSDAELKFLDAAFLT